MELREFAEQVLFATSLEEKLRTPEVITDECPGSVLPTPLAPGRPASLVFKAHAAGKSEFPGLHRLEQVSERGKLLHFFCNHELLATELMALVLLKFPDAPAAFRKGVLQTLKDEQAHTRLYLDRMKACGVQLGDFPVSGYFWRCVAPMVHPIDYVAGLSLTFEQANLDFARFFSGRFGAVGDAETAQLLEKIYRDEIGHVAYGLRWFRRWKTPGSSDWEAFCRTLKFPLSPQRAKGFNLNFAGRQAAGLDENFIAQLNVYSQSKGRTPNVFLFNPFTEGRLAEGRRFNPTKPQAQLARDLENLPQFLCRQDDVVLLERRPAVEFLSHIKQAGFPLPEFVSLPTGMGELASRKLGALRPWAWGPDSMDTLKPLFSSITREPISAGSHFNQHIAQFYSKAWSAAFLRQLICENNSRADSVFARWICTEDEIGVAVHSLAAAEEALAAIRARGHQRIVLKSAFGVAGSNALRVFEPELQPAQRRWLENLFAQNREVVVEPWLDRVLDFSVQLEMNARGLKLSGFTGLINDARGQFIANFAEPHFHQRLPVRVIAKFRAAADVSGYLLAMYEEIFSRLESELRAAGFSGPLGIDAFVYRTADGQIRLKPVVEINPRYTMGRVLVELMGRVAQGVSGVFRLVNPSQLRALGLAGFTAYARRLAEREPLRLEGELQPRIREGALCLNDPGEVQVCLATFQAGARVEDLLPELKLEN